MTNEELDDKIEAVRREIMNHLVGQSALVELVAARVEFTVNELLDVHETARKLANLATVTVTPPTDKVRDLALTPRYDLQLPAVIIRFKSTNTADGNSWVDIATQKYPVDATGLELGASVHTIELSGSNLTRSKAEVTLAAVDAQSVTEATRIAWWKEKLELLKDTKIDAASLHITSAYIKDANGDTVSLASYPRELVDGTLPD